MQFDYYKHNPSKPNDASFMGRVPVSGMWIVRLPGRCGCNLTTVIMMCRMYTIDYTSHERYDQGRDSVRRCREWLRVQGGVLRSDAWTTWNVRIHEEGGLIRSRALGSSKWRLDRHWNYVGGFKARHVFCQELILPGVGFNTRPSRSKPRRGLMTWESCTQRGPRMRARWRWNVASSNPYF
jgi:hypothetical protein